MKTLLNGWAPIIKAGTVSVVSAIALLLVWTNITSTKEALAKLQTLSEQNVQLSSQNVHRLDIRDERLERLNVTMKRLAESAELQIHILLDICDRLSRDQAERRECRRFATR